MAKIIVVTSGKGGVGKTTSSAAIATGLAMRGHKTIAIDFDIGLRNLDLVMGCEKSIVFDIVNVINKDATLSEAIIKDKHTENLFILPASQTREKEALTKEGIRTILEELHDKFDYVVCDSPAGIEKGAQLAMHYADHAIIVTNPEVASVRDADRILGLLATKTRRAEEKLAPVHEHLLLTRYAKDRAKKGDILTIDDIVKILNIPLLGVIPESHEVIRASNHGRPIILNRKSDIACAYKKAVANFLGENKQSKSLGKKIKNMFGKIFKKKGKDRG